MRVYLIVHPEQNGFYPYSLVDEEVLKTIPKEQIYKKKIVSSNKIYTKEELENLRNELL